MAGVCWSMPANNVFNEANSGKVRPLFQTLFLGLFLTIGLETLDRSIWCWTMLRAITMLQISRCSYSPNADIIQALGLMVLLCNVNGPDVEQIWVQSRVTIVQLESKWRYREGHVTLAKSRSTYLLVQYFPIQINNGLFCNLVCFAHLPYSKWSQTDMQGAYGRWGIDFYKRSAYILFKNIMQLCCFYNSLSY